MSFSKFILTISAFLPLSMLLTLDSFGQRWGVNDTILTSAIIYNGDTIEAKTLPMVETYYTLTEAQRRYRREYNRLRNAVYVTYPYARRAGTVMNEINLSLAGITDNEKGRNSFTTGKGTLRKNLPNRSPIYRFTRVRC